MMGRLSPALVMQVAGSFAWLLAGAMARPAVAQVPVPAAPASSFADLVSPEETPQPPVQPFDPSTWSGRTEYPLSQVILESILGKPDPSSWRPLPLSTLFSEGWNEAWVPSPNGSGGAPRQGWINASDGNLYRLSFFTFSQSFNSGTKGNAYLGAYTIFLPFSRRLNLIVNVPFVLRNNAGSGLPIIGRNGQSQPERAETTFGDLSFTPRVLLHETKDWSFTAEMAVLVPTGNQPVAGKTALTPGFAFWNNFADRWVIRGGIADFIPLGGGTNNLISQLAIGQTLTDHDVPLFGDFTWYVSTVVNTPLRQGEHTSVTLTPGLRTHVGNDWYFLAGLPTPVTTERIGDLGMIFWFMKAW